MTTQTVKKKSPSLSRSVWRGRLIVFWKREFVSPGLKKTYLKRDQKAFKFVQRAALIPAGAQRRSLCGILHQAVITTRGIRLACGEENIHYRAWNQPVMFAWAARGKKKDLKLNGMETLSEFCNNRVVPMPAVQTSGFNAWRFGDMGNVSVPKTRIPLHARGKNIGVDNTWLLQQHFPVTLNNSPSFRNESQDADNAGELIP